MTFNIAPAPIDEEEFLQCIAPMLAGATGLGMYVATFPASANWTQHDFCEFDLADHLTICAIDAVTDWASDNQRFYNRTKLEDAVTLALCKAFARGFRHVASSPLANIAIDE